jgi:hypothetical protein
MQINLYISTAARLAITALFLFIVWLHSHWSVALAITLIAINNELQSSTTRTILQRLRALEAGKWPRTGIL